MPSTGLKNNTDGSLSMLILEKIENLTGYRLIKIHFILFCACIFQYLTEGTIHFSRENNTGLVILSNREAYFSCRAGNYGCGAGIVGMCRVVRNGSRTGLAATVTFRSMACPFLYTVKVMLSPTDLC